MTAATRDSVRADAASAPDLRAVLDAQQQAFRREGEVTVAVRRDRLKRLRSALTSHAEQLATAIDADFGTRARAVSLGGDVFYTAAEIAELSAMLPRWVKPERPRRFAGRVGWTQEVTRAPLGVVGVAGPWNFPVQLSMVPAAGVIAAGNRVMVRPSSGSPRTGEVLATAIAKFMDPEECAVITPDYGPGSAFSKLPFDGFFFTGSPEVGRQVARDCAQNLVPVTLELGGKNPVVVDRDVKIDRAAQRIAAAKIFNSGQICLSLDYVFVPTELADRFVEEVLATWQRLCPSILDCPDYTAIGNDANFDRIVAHIADARAKGATVHQVIPQRENLPHRASRKIPPTLVTGIKPGMTIDGDEIFGPVLSMYTYDDIAEPIDFIARHDSPLALYWHGPDNERKRELVSRTRSGAVNANEMMLHMLPGLGMPFGGVGKSGYGRYHGRNSIEAFTYARSSVHYGGPGSAYTMLGPRNIGRLSPMYAAISRLLR
ncbi:aldehyde dehydrogenase family protein [Mycolicibacter minnesotensis]